MYILAFNLTDPKKLNSGSSLKISNKCNVPVLIMRQWYSFIITKILLEEVHYLKCIFTQCFESWTWVDPTPKTLSVNRISTYFTKILYNILYADFSCIPLNLLRDIIKKHNVWKLKCWSSFFNLNKLHLLYWTYLTNSTWN